MSASVAAYLGSQIAKNQEAAPEVAEIWGRIETLYSQRLWHQLTVELLGFVGHEALEDGLVELHASLIKDLADRMAPMSLTRILLKVTEQIADTQEAITFLEGPQALGKVKATPLAVAAIKTEIARLKMDLDQVPEAEKLLAECLEVLDAQPGITPTHVDYYRVSSVLRSTQEDYEGYYADSLRYLGCVKLEDLSDEEKAGRAFDLGLAALCGPSIYNVGELLAHPVLNALRDTAQEWLVDLLYAFNSGNVDKFEETKPLWSSKSSDLADKDAMLREKFELLAVMEAVFRRGTADRMITFAELAEAVSVPVGRVEMVVMKALSKGLVKGTIDQIESVVHFTWVQPRVLDMDQISGMRDRLGAWLASVKKGSTLVQTGAPELMAAP